MSRESAAFVRKHHDYMKVSRQYIEMYDGLLSQLIAILAYDQDKEECYMQDRETGEVMMNGFDMEYSNFRSKASDVYSKLSNLRSKLSDAHTKLCVDTTITC